ncbi:hypothetical protein [Listeria seeligeri]|uniref:hypothetical protein n=1 Tax=Listeria seeligeri TaxID=1640 RepID=UPI001628801C|nr:hypothetical protein [Listeria seeligeri]MBC1723775.1 hypothetical protein [Listeria seeligeri]
MEIHLNGFPDIWNFYAKEDISEDLAMELIRKKAPKENESFSFQMKKEEIDPTINLKAVFFFDYSEESNALVYRGHDF